MDINALVLEESFILFNTAKHFNQPPFFLFNKTSGLIPPIRGRYPFRSFPTCVIGNLSPSPSFPTVVIGNPSYLTFFGWIPADSWWGWQKEVVMPGIRHRASLPIAVIPDGGYREIHLKLVRMDPRRLLVGMKEVSCDARYSSLGISPLRSFPTFLIGSQAAFSSDRYPPETAGMTATRWIPADDLWGWQKREIKPRDQPAGKATSVFSV